VDKAIIQYVGPAQRREVDDLVWDAANDYATVVSGPGIIAMLLAQPGEFQVVVEIKGEDLESLGLDTATWGEFLGHLRPHSPEARGWMEHLGIVEGDTNKFLDASREIRSRAELAEVLREALTDTPDDQREQALTQMFGDQGAEAAKKLLGVNDGAQRNSSIRTKTAKAD
jgi:hypothetical protein